MPPKPKPLITACYLRVSLDKQDTENQKLALQKVVEARGYDLKSVQWFIDKSQRGFKHYTKRPALNRLLELANEGKVQRIICWSVDRLGRNNLHLLEVEALITKKSIHLLCPKDGIDTESDHAHGKTMFGLHAWLAQTESTRCSERVKAGLKLAVAKGKKLGPKFKTTQQQRALVLQLHRLGTGYRSIAQQTGLSLSTVCRVIQASTQEAHHAHTTTA
jgi:DNA invertase Pin-like site-specific DNA recombinase